MALVKVRLNGRDYSLCFIGDQPGRWLNIRLKRESQPARGNIAQLSRPHTLRFAPAAASESGQEQNHAEQ